MNPSYHDFVRALLCTHGCMATHFTEGRKVHYHAMIFLKWQTVKTWQSDIFCPRIISFRGGGGLPPQTPLHTPSCALLVYHQHCVWTVAGIMATGNGQDLHSNCQTPCNLNQHTESMNVRGDVDKLGNIIWRNKNFTSQTTKIWRLSEL